MAFARVFSGQVEFLQGSIIPVEADVARGLYSFAIVGLADKAVDEAKDRVSAALKNQGFTSPKSKNEKILISLLPTDTRKEGGYFDVAIALSYLLATNEIHFDPNQKLFLGSLSLSGAVLPVKGILPIIQKGIQEGFTEFFVPVDNSEEVSILEGVTIYTIKTIAELVGHLHSKQTLERFTQPVVKTTHAHVIDFSYIKGQENAKRGLLIAAAGGHNIALSGPPGTGKSLLGKAFTGILPELSKTEIIEVTGIHSTVHGKHTLIWDRPFRAPHHTSSYVAIIGGGSVIKPGEVTLAHRGVLFLDEFPEFDKKVLETLRQPLEDNIVSISRARGSVTFPSNFILVASMNPCPCGYYETGVKPCTCSHNDIDRYQKKLSGPIVDRIDLWVYVSPVSYEMLHETPTAKESPVLQKQVEHARNIQKERFINHPHICTNSDMGAKDIMTFALIEESAEKLLVKSAEKLQLSARSYHRIIKLARTIADLEGSKTIQSSHILEALQYRPKKTE